MENKKLEKNRFEELGIDQLYSISGGEDREVGGVVCGVVYYVYYLVTGGKK